MSVLCTTCNAQILVRPSQENMRYCRGVRLLLHSFLILLFAAQMYEKNIILIIFSSKSRGSSPNACQLVKILSIQSIEVASHTENFIIFVFMNKIRPCRAEININIYEEGSLVVICHRSGQRERRREKGQRKRHMRGR